MPNSRIVVMGLIVLASLGNVGCGAMKKSALGGGALDDGGNVSVVGSSQAPPLVSLETLALRGPTEAPLMRETLRIDHAAPRSPDVPAEREVCLRAVFAADTAVRAWFADAHGEPGPT